MIVDAGCQNVSHKLTQDISCIFGKKYYAYNDELESYEEFDPVTRRYSSYEMDECKAQIYNSSLDDQEGVVGVVKVLEQSHLDDFGTLYPYLGDLYERAYPEVLIGVNGSNVAAGEGYILPRGLTVTSLKNKTWAPNLFLGDLETVHKYGYGLYCDNVYLKGALTTEGDSGLLTGINTN
jgi:hypothetical protein